MNTRFTTLLVAATAIALTNVAIAAECPAKEGCPAVAKADGKGKARRITPEQRAEMLKKYDKNNDGKIDAEERAAMRAERKMGAGRREGKSEAKGEGRGEGRGKGQGAGKGAAAPQEG
ncbi:MAG: EF-hand domain-containing protein [Kiritimatiellia bacterium]